MSLLGTIQTNFFIYCTYIVYQSVGLALLMLSFGGHISNTILTWYLNTYKTYSILYCYKIIITIIKYFSPTKVLPALRKHFEA